MNICPNCSLLKGAPGHAYSIATPMCRCSPPVGEDYWRVEAQRYAANTDYWRSKFNALAEKVAVPEHTINTTHKVAVATDVYWQPIETAPRGVKVQLLGKGNVATYGTYFGDKFWTHWCPLPKKQKETT